MNTVPRMFSVLGVASGLLFAVGPFMFGVPGSSPGFVIAPIILGALLAANHWGNLRRLRNPAAKPSRGVLLTSNVLLLVFFLIGFSWLCSRYTGTGRNLYFLAGFVLLWPLPLVVNAIYLLVGSRRGHE